MSDSWIAENINRAFEIWNESLETIWNFVTTSPENFKGGAVWDSIVSINSLMIGIGYGLLILFFAISIFKSTLSFEEFKRPEKTLRHFIHFVLAKVAVGRAMELLATVYEICSGVILNVSGYMGAIAGANAGLPSSLVTAIDKVGFFASVPLWIVTLIGSLFVTILSFVLIFTIYGRFFKIYMYTALAPLPLSTLGGEGTSKHAKTFLKNYAGVCLEGVIVVLACVIFGAFVSADEIVIPAGTALTQVISYLTESIFNMLVLVGLVKGSNQIVKEILGL